MRSRDTRRRWRRGGRTRDAEIPVTARRRWRSALELRRSVRALMRELDATVPLDVEDLCAKLAAKRGRPIELVPYPLPVPGPFGLWLATTHRDLVLYQVETTRGHQEHIILHEVGHIISEHPGDETDDRALAEIAPTLPPETVRRALRRTGYDDAQEHEAELVATVIKEWALLLDELGVGRHRAEADASRLPSLREAFGDHQGWL